MRVKKQNRLNMGQLRPNRHNQRQLLHSWIRPAERGFRLLARRCPLFICSRNGYVQAGAGRPTGCSQSVVVRHGKIFYLRLQNLWEKPTEKPNATNHCHDNSLPPFKFSNQFPIWKVRSVFHMRPLSSLDLGGYKVRWAFSRSPKRSWGQRFFV